MWGRCKRYVKETRWGVKWNLGGGVSGASGQAGGEVSPAQRLADKTLLYLDIVQHYYCTQAEEAEKQARKARDEKERATSTARQIEMQKKRDEVFQTLTNLAMKIKEPQEARTFLTEHASELLEYGREIADVTKDLEGLQFTFEEFIERTPSEKTGIKSAGEVKAGGAVIGQQEISKARDVYQGPVTIIQQTSPELEERVRKLEERLAPGPTKEETEKQMDALQMQLTERDLENSRLHLELGLERLKDKRYEEAIKDLQEALRPLPEDSEAAASALWNMGIALIEWPRGNRLKNLTEAVEAYKKVIRVYTREKSPERFAGTQNNLGTAYGVLSEVRDKEANLGLAIEYLNEALRVRTFEAFPQDYAMTQNNLGTAYGVLSEVRDKEANLGLAIRAYNEALRVRTFEAFPQDYAMTQNNLGEAYWGLSEVRDKEANLGLAIRAYNEALRVYTKEALPWYFVVTSGNLAWALSMKGEITEAVRVMEEMLPVAEEVGHPRLKDYRKVYEGLKSAR